MQGTFYTQSVLPLLSPQALTADEVTTVIDLENYDSQLFVLNIGAEGDTLSDTLYWQIQIQKSDDNINWRSVDSWDVLGAELDAQNSILNINGSGDEGTPTNPGTTGAVFKVGYLGVQRYLRMLINAEGTHTVGTVFSLTGHAAHAKRSEVNKP